MFFLRDHLFSNILSDFSNCAFICCYYYALTFFDILLLSVVGKQYLFITLNSTILNGFDNSSFQFPCFSAFWIYRDVHFIHRQRLLVPKDVGSKVLIFSSFCVLIDLSSYRIFSNFPSSTNVCHLSTRQMKKVPLFWWLVTLSGWVCVLVASC